MVWYTYESTVVVDTGTELLLLGETGGTFRLSKDSDPLPLFDLNLAPISEIVSSAIGLSSTFRVEDAPRGVIQFGDIAVPVKAEELFDYALLAPEALANSQAALLQAQSALEQATQAAAAAQAAQLAAEEAANNQGSGGLNVAQLDAHLAGTTTNPPSSQGIFNRALMVRVRTGTGNPPTGPWEARPNFPRVISVGLAPKPTDEAVTDLAIELYP